jgi:LCP family protein required for cell wall assembly
MEHRSDSHRGAARDPGAAKPLPARTSSHGLVGFISVTLLVLLLITAGAAILGRLTAEPNAPSEPITQASGNAPPESLAPKTSPDSTDGAIPSTRGWGGLRQVAAGEPTALGEAALAAVAQPGTPSPLTILLLGVDARPGEAIDAGIRADAIAVLRLDPERRSCRLLTIPRDTRVDLPGYGLSKINHALSVGGVPYQTQVVEQFLGLEVDRFALADFTGFSAVIDAIGGVPITVRENFSLGEHTFAPGEQVLNGDQALAYVRYRGGEDGDFGRVARQQQMLRAIVAQGVRPEVVLSLGQILAAVDAHVRTDLPVLELTSLLAYYQAACGPSAIVMETLSGEIATFPDPLVSQELSYVLVSDEEKTARVAALLGTDQ